ncbi:hypothetical protein NEMIN01_2117 [Nematocida minor]|uniref:uncharacterized protein n=1 Tax=Nematocida minor TaxID=1912983 RepID=UPI00221F0C18|nr:uncharacterized protein NEMIN01_2117 [Nematocida minor]KAI5192618.1 hypothetical protein NEMIN01_2117 [Nematocida minor]
MVAKKVKLNIDVGGVVQTCLSISSVDDMCAPIYLSNRMSYMTILKHILNRSLKIESDQYNAREKESVLNIIKNGICQYFIYNRIVAQIINRMHSALQNRDDATIRHNAICLVNELIKPNRFVYNTEHGMAREIDMNSLLENIDPDDSNADLSPRAYTLEVNDESLERMLQSTAKSLDRHILSYISNSVHLKCIEKLKKYSSVEEFYTLDDLYTLTKDGAPLVDYGLRLIQEKYYKIVDLVDLIRGIEVISNKPQNLIKKEVSELFTAEDLRIAISISDHLEKISYEKKIHKCVIKSLEYLANSTDLLDEKDGSKVLKIKPDLSDFYGNYVFNKGLNEIVYEKEVELSDEIIKARASLSTEKINCAEKEADLQEWENTADHSSPDYSQIRREKAEAVEVARRRANCLENKIYLLSCDNKKEELQNDSNFELLISLNNLSDISPAQKQYILERIEEFSEAHSVKVEVAKEIKPFSIKITREKLIKMLILGVICTAALVLFTAQSKDRALAINNFK